MTATSGLKLAVLLTKQDPVFSLAKMFLGSSRWRNSIVFLRWQVMAVPSEITETFSLALDADTSCKFWKTLSRSTTPSSRSLFLLVPWTQSTDDSDSGLWLTPNAMDSLEARDEAALLHQRERNRPGRTTHSTLREQATLPPPAELWPTPTQDSSNERTTPYAQGGTPLTVAVKKMFPTPVSGMADRGDRGDLNTIVKGYESPSGHTTMWPTPRSGKTTNEDEESWARRQAQGKVATPPLSLAVKLWPTPQEDDSSNVNPSEKRRETLVKRVMAREIWPTPTAVDYKGWSPGHNRADLDNRLDFAVERREENPKGGSLNPDWVEWLMGYPIGWTTLTPQSRESPPAQPTE